MAEAALRLVVRTPRGAILDEPVVSLRVQADSGHVGLRPRAERAALVVEPGLVIATGPAGRRFLATAGGLLRCDGREAVLLTPVAVVAESAASVTARLEEALRAPGTDLALRAALQRLETGILRELRRGGSARLEPAGGDGG